VRAHWFHAHRRACGCFQKVCPLRFERFWAQANLNGSRDATHRLIRQRVRNYCKFPASAPRLWEKASWRWQHPLQQGERNGGEQLTVRLLERSQADGRQLEGSARAALVATITRATGAHPLFVRASTPTHTASEPRGDGSSFRANHSSVLCEQVRWFADVDVVVVMHGAATTNALWADANTLVIDVAPYAYRHEPSAPSEYYEALLDGTDVSYMLLRTPRPIAPLSTASATGVQYSTTLVAEQCSADKACRLAYRDHCCISLDEDALLNVERAIVQHGRAKAYGRARAIANGGKSPLTE